MHYWRHLQERCSSLPESIVKTPELYSFFAVTSFSLWLVASSVRLQMQGLGVPFRLPNPEKLWGHDMQDRRGNHRVWKVWLLGRAGLIRGKRTGLEKNLKILFYIGLFSCRFYYAPRNAPTVVGLVAYVVGPQDTLSHCFCNDIFRIRTLWDILKQRNGGADGTQETS